MLFGRAFEVALGAYFRAEDAGEVFFREWSAYKDQCLLFSKGNNWDRMLEQGIMLLIRFPQNPCTTCPYVGLCLGRQEMIDVSLVRRPGAENFGWLDELNY